jgi:hypothetical protein
VFCTGAGQPQVRFWRVMPNCINATRLLFWHKINQVSAYVLGYVNVVV